MHILQIILGTTEKDVQGQGLICESLQSCLVIAHASENCGSYSMIIDDYSPPTNQKKPRKKSQLFRRPGSPTRLILAESLYHPKAVSQYKLLLPGYRVYYLDVQ